MLINKFYTILSTDDTGPVTGENKGGKQYKCTIELDKQHPIYKGHFPGNPVVPGVCQIQIIGELFSGIIGKQVTLTCSDNIKFLHMIDPRIHHVLNISLIYTGKDENEWDVTSLISGDDLIFLKFRGRYVS
ncbi:MAG: 3-hydroxyacyl-ACP dehydratase [Bacteroidetes bacterium]|nr:3-hydroxyacyl-ACP dehydratase [Bacteroidota bacterium]